MAKVEQQEPIVIEATDAGSSVQRNVIMKRIGLRVRFAKKTFSFWQRLGFNLTLNAYDQPIPDLGELKEDLWMKNSELVGIDINERKQLDLLVSFESAFKDEYDVLPKDRTSTPYQYFLDNGAFGSVDGEILYCMIRHFKPKKIFEIGSGNSTYLSAQAILKNRKEDEPYECELVAIDPHPNGTLKAGFPGLARLAPMKVQDLPLQEFSKLAKNDILFIDSSHVVRIGNDVTYEYLDVIPRLNEGVIVHSHDIFLPAQVCKNTIMKDHLFWNEQYLLQAFLAFNEHFEVLWAANYMHLKHPDKLEKAFNSYKRDSNSPGSFWMRRKSVT